jgi:hypothetical protein
LAFGRTICSVVTCEGGITTISYNPLPSQNPRSLGTSPLDLTFLKRKNHPIVVTLGGIGSCYASLAFKPQAFYPCYKLCDNKYLRMSFGLLNAGATFQRAMDFSFKELMGKIIEIYQDDLTVFSKERSDHIGHLRQVFERCRKYGISLNPTSSILGVD